MPRDRQAPRFDPQAGLTPVAMPVDTYSGAKASNPMLELAGALRSLNPALNNYMAVEKEKIDATDFQAGQAAYLKAKSNLKDAVDRGTIDAGFSPAFRRGYEQGQLRVVGLNYDKELREAYSQSAAANSDDPNAYQNFVSDFTSQFMEKNGIQKNFHPLDIGQTFTPAIEQAQRSLSHYHVEQRAKTIEDNWAANTENEVSTTIDNALANGYSHEQTGAAVNAVIGKAMSNGWHDKSTFNQNIVKLVSEKAISSGDEGMLEVLKHIPTGPGGNLGNTTFARTHALAASQQIMNQKRDDIRWQWSQQQQERSEQQFKWAQEEHARSNLEYSRSQSSGAYLRGLVAKVIQDPTSVTDAEVQKLNSLDRDGSAARTFLSFKHSYLENKASGADNPQAVTGLYTKMYANPRSFNPNEIIQAQANGYISMRTMTSMLDDQRRAADAGASPLLRDPIYNTLMDGVTKAFQGDPNEFDVTKTSKTTAARLAFQKHALEYVSKNKDNLDANAFYDEMEKFQKRLIKPLLDAEKAPAKPAQGQQGNNPYAQSGMAR